MCDLYNYRIIIVAFCYSYETHGNLIYSLTCSSRSVYAPGTLMIMIHTWNSYLNFTKSWSLFLFLWDNIKHWVKRCLIFQLRLSALHKQICVFCKQSIETEHVQSFKCSFSTTSKCLHTVATAIHRLGQFSKGIEWPR